MMKFLFLIIFMNFMKKSSLMNMFFYNLCFLISFMYMFNYNKKFNELNFMSLSLNLGIDEYSYMLIMLVFWISGLMLMTLEKDFLSKNISMLMFLLMILVLTFSSMNMMMFYLFFEISLIPMFFIIIFNGGNSERLSASFYFLLYTMILSLPFLIYLFKIYNFLGSLSLFLLVKMKVMEISFWGIMLILMVFLIKLPLYMFHIWLPKAHVEAPVYGSMILAAVLLKLGGYGLMRMIMILLDLLIKFNLIIMSLSMIGSLLISFTCLVQIDMKSLVAYSSIIHMNLMISSLMTMVKASFISSVMVMISHGLCSSGLFFLVNIFYKRSLSRLMILNKGILKMMMKFSFWWFMFCLINFSFPFSVNFLGEIFLLMILVNWNFLIYLLVICFLSCAYSLYLFSFIFHGESFEVKKFNSGNLMEFLILILHYYPLLLFLINMIMFY